MRSALLTRPFLCPYPPFYCFLWGNSTGWDAMRHSPSFFFFFLNPWSCCTSGVVSEWNRKTGVEIGAEDPSVSLRKPSPRTRAPAAQVLSPSVSCAATFCRSQGWTRILHRLCCLVSKVKAWVCHDLWLSFQPILFYTFWKLSLGSGEIARFLLFSLF